MNAEGERHDGLPCATGTGGVPPANVGTAECPRELKCRGVALTSNFTLVERSETVVKLLKRDRALRIGKPQSSGKDVSTLKL